MIKDDLLRGQISDIIHNLAGQSQYADNNEEREKIETAIKILEELLE